MSQITFNNMKYSFTKAFKELNSDQKKQIKEYVNTWILTDSNNKRIVKNCKKEHFLDSSYFLDLFKLILTYDIKDFPNKLNEIYNYFYKYKLCASSPAINKIKRVGFVLLESSIRRNIEDNFYDIFHRDDREVNLFIQDLKINSIDKNLSFMNIKKYDDVIWLTFSEFSNNPFDFQLRYDRLEIFSILALSEHYRDSPIFLFTVELNNLLISKLKKATVFDAKNNPQFKPPSINQIDYGYTKPIKIKNYSHANVPRPEIVCDAREFKYRHIVDSKYI